MKERRHVQSLIWQQLTWEQFRRFEELPAVLEELGFNRAGARLMQSFAVKEAPVFVP